LGYSRASLGTSACHVHNCRVGGANLTMNYKAGVIPVSDKLSYLMSQGSNMRTYSDIS
jgi:hypothetical protein